MSPKMLDLTLNIYSDEKATWLVIIHIIRASPSTSYTDHSKKQKLYEQKTTTINHKRKMRHKSSI